MAFIDACLVLGILGAFLASLGKFNILFITGILILPLFLPKIRGVNRKRTCEKALLAAGPLLFLMGFLLFSLDNKPTDVERRLLNEESVKIDGVYRIEIKERATSTLRVITDGGFVVFLKEEEADDLEAGDLVTISGYAELLSSPLNPGEMDLSLYYRSRGVRFFVDCKEIKLIEKNKNIVRALIKYVKTKAENVLNRYSDKESTALLKAILLGEKDEIPEEVQSLFRYGGINHLLVVSGFHITMIGHGIFSILRKLRRHRYTCVICSFLGVMFFAALCGGVSAERGVLLFGFSAAASIAGRTVDMKTSSLTAMAFMLIRKPYLFYSSGFVLSFAYILAIAFIFPEIEKAMEHKIASEVLRGNISCGIAMYLVNVILSAVYYYEVPLFSFVMNLILIPFVPFIMGSSFLGLAASFISPLGEIAYYPATFILKAFTGVCSTISHIPGSMVVSGKPEALSLIIAVTAFIYGIFFIGRRRIKAGIFFIIIMVSGIFYRPENSLKIMFPYVGQGDCIIIKNRNNGCILIDGGSSSEDDVGIYKILPILKSMGIDRIDACILTHMDDDHINGIEGIIKGMPLNNIKIERILLSCITKDQERMYALTDIALSKGIDIGYLKRGDLITQGELKINCIYPYPGIRPRDENSCSIVLTAEYRDLKILFTGDIDSHIEEIIIKENDLEETDVLKVSHHGSKFGTCMNMLEEARPEYAIISCRENNIYGHPHKAVLERLNTIKSTVLKTYESGCITVEYRNGAEVKVFK